MPVAAVATAATPPPSTPAAVAPAPKPANTTAPSAQTLAQLHVESTSVEAAPAASVTRARPAAAPATATAAAGSAPVLTRRVEPAYPPEAKRARRQGWVDVTFTVQADGSVAGATVADSEPRYVFDRAALSAVSHWQFSPGMQDGKPVAAQLRQRIEFRL